MGISQAAAARILGVTRQAVRSRIKYGTLTLLPDRTLDEREVRAAAQMRNPSRSDTAQKAALRSRKARRATAPERRGPRPPERVEARTEDERRRDERLEAEYAAYQRHRKRLTRRHRLGLPTRFVRSEVIGWSNFALVAHAFEILRSYADVMVDRGAPSEWMASQVQRSLDALNLTSVQWLADREGMILAADEPCCRWRSTRHTGATLAHNTRPTDSKSGDT